MTATNAVPVDSSNVEQLRAWDGDEGEYWADHAEYFDRSVAAYHERLLAAAAIGDARPGARHRLRDRSDHPGRRPRRVRGLRARGRPVVAHARPRPPPRRRGRRHQRDVRAGRRADPPLRARRLRRGDQPHRGDVLRRPRRRVPQHRHGPASGWTPRARDLAAVGWQRVDPRDLRGARRRARPPGAARRRAARSRSPTPTAFAACSPRPGSPTSSSTGRPPACGSATTPTTPTASCSA